MVNIVSKLARLRLGRPIVQRANAHRDRSDWLEAVIAYRRALEWLPWREDLHIQIGNCLKEYGDYRGAVKAYGAVTSGAHRPEALKQMADANRRAGADILPYMVAERSDQVPAVATGALVPVPSARDLPNRVQIETMEPRRWLGSLGRDDSHGMRIRGNNYPSIMFDQVGAMSMVRDGAIEPLFAGVVAIRARIFSLAKVETVELWLGEGAAATRIEVAPVKPVDRRLMPIRLHIANIWVDSGRLPPGRHWLSLTAGNQAPAAGLFVNVAEPNGDANDLADSDAFVPSPTGSGDVAEAILARPATARPAARSLFGGAIRSILALRVDQLGDVAASLPALVRLRELFPEATLTALVQPGVHAVVEASGVVDRVITMTLPYSAATERRQLLPEEEARVRAVLAAERYDLAIDLCVGDETRPLLLLTGARWLVGFNSDRFTFLDYGIGLRSRDKVNQLEAIPHAAAVLALVESLALAATPTRKPVPRAAPSDSALAAYGLVPNGHVVLHLGARHPINRWPAGNFLDLAERLLAETDSTVVIFADDPADCTRATLRDSERVRFLDMIDADAFDAIISTARLMVGNDSGPKHLAATRGVPTVSLHVDRLNWNEWGQDGRGLILSRRVPCTGCGLNDVQLCGREAVCLRSISVEDAWKAARELL